MVLDVDFEKENVCFTPAARRRHAADDKNYKTPSALTSRNVNIECETASNSKARKLKPDNSPMSCQKLTFHAALRGTANQSVLCDTRIAPDSSIWFWTWTLRRRMCASRPRRAGGTQPTIKTIRHPVL
mmetsp:Transcript_65618/g.175893  ORF Transcript_65618/g.175893 Transcript_65618/m.175893 type:complete len:128 (+) Transcript_65618:59-442(+)